VAASVRSVMIVVPLREWKVTPLIFRLCALIDTEVRRIYDHANILENS
jgi:hypothetical protein